MQLNPSEISELIKKRIEKFEAVAEVRNEGTVVSITDGIVRVHGLADVMAGEMLEFPRDTFGMALNLERDSVGAVILGDYEHISEGDSVKCTGRILEVPVGEALLGRVIDALGRRSYLTSIAFGPSIGKNIGLAYLPYAYCQEGRELITDYLGEQFPMQVAAVGCKALYDPDNKRPRS